MQQHEVSRQSGDLDEDRGQTLPPDIGWTALLTAHMRAVESLREDRLFDDPLATAVVDLVRRTARTDPDALPTGPEDDTGDLTEAWYMLATYLAVRTRYYDERTLAAVAAGIRQVVILAAGLDSRAVRLGLPADTVVYEVDTEPVLRFKESVLESARLKPGSQRRPVDADLRGHWGEKLGEAGFVPERPTMWIVEGLFMYLAPEDCARLLDSVTSLSAPGSRIALEYFESNPGPEDVTTVDDVEAAVIGRIVSFFQGGPHVSPGEWLRGHGWEPDVTTLARETIARGRDIPEMFREGRPHEVSLWLAHGLLH
ncbi:SAM-dependent methyltransferase [Streptomyces sp. NPDC013157]|uniref:SAM-dependent methyltransferase n=1 Tax=Streptomyces sp. NPDC013157 TaxID=3364861 RepID=UPI00368AF562